MQEYCSILFLKPKMKIVLRGEKVQTRLVEHNLSQTEKDVYRPRWLVSHTVNVKAIAVNSPRLKVGCMGEDVVCVAVQ